jgi:hypothetical protein
VGTTIGARFIADRRVQPRFAPDALPAVQISLATGHRLQPTGWGPRSLAFASSVPLRPGRSVLLQLRTEGGVIRATGQVARCRVTALEPDLRYEAAVLVDSPWPWMPLPG